MVDQPTPRFQRVGIEYRVAKEVGRGQDLKPWEIGNLSVHIALHRAPGRSSWRVRTFVGVDDIVLDDDVPPIDCVILLRLPPHLAQVGRRLLPAGGGSASWLGRVGYAQDMAGEELFSGDGVGEAGAGGRFGLAGGEQDICGGDQEDMALGGKALGREGALEEGGEERV